jgi:hypothetical protein
VVSHRFDPVALVFGLVFTAAGAIVLSGGELIDEGRPVIPAGLIALGLALLVQVVRRARPGDEAPSAVAAATLPDPAAWGDSSGPSSPGSEADHLDRLFAPVDDELARWDADIATNAAPGADGPDGGDDADPADDGGDDVDPADADPSDLDTTDTIDPPDAGVRDGDPSNVDALDRNPTDGDPTHVDPTEASDPTTPYDRPGGPERPDE